MARPVRATLTLIGAGAAGLLIWLSTQFGESLGAYWATAGVLAAAGLVLPLSQLFGGWTKWGWPRFAPSVLLLGFLPAFVVVAWVLLSGQPDDNWFQRHTTSWSGDLHIARLVRHLRETYWDVLAFGLGVVFGFSFDTTGPRARAAPAVPPPATTVAEREEPEAAETRVTRGPDEADTRVAAPARENPPTES
jgi:hypothetical protein